jgi:hypothetical protein
MLPHRLRYDTPSSLHAVDDMLTGCPALPAAANNSSCQVLLVRNFSVPFSPVGLQEVLLYDASGGQLPAAALTLKLSSQANANTPASNCNDGSTNDGRLCLSQEYDQDASPWLAVIYPCSQELGQVVVYNRKDIRLSHVKAYTLQVWQRGQLIKQEAFAGAKLVYSFTVAGGSTAAG